ncbi:hypothetical protein A0H81_03114 [Grifola frondosa]|uniref:Uncharacterized protein n=1 Tax=Grifola frondosa TaxID=5627 RepID=A0A1C7MJL6_GRIFR|nr:hypothetical protein A0H81_03114 [Grifola frondosa]
MAVLGSGIFAKEGVCAPQSRDSSGIHHFLHWSCFSLPRPPTSAHLPAIAALGNAVALKAVYSRSEKSAAGFASVAQKTLKLSELPGVYHDEDPSVSLDVLLARPDISAVIVVLPITTQPSIILKALGAGKHVLSEKPVAPDVAGGIALIKEYETKFKSKGLVWRVAENYEAEPGYQVAAQAIKNAKIGKVTFYNARVVNFIDQDSKWYKTPWRTVPDYQGGFLLDGGVHTVAALRVMLPSPMKTLSSFASLNKEWLAPHDTINAIVQSADGAHGIVELTFASPTPSRAELAGNGITITGTDGWLSVNQATVLDGDTSVRVFRITIRKLQKDKDGKEVGETVEVLEEKVAGIEKELESFLQAIAGSNDELGSVQGALKDVAFIQAALTSNGSPIDLEKLVQ